jgi:hypothetical protein
LVSTEIGQILFDRRHDFGHHAEPVCLIRLISRLPAMRESCRVNEHHDRGPPMRRLSYFLALAIGFLSESALATVLLDEPFDYSNGSLVDNSGGNWTVVSGTVQPVTVVNDAVVGLGHGTGQGGREDVVREFAGADISSGALYLSFSFTVTSAPTAGSEYFLGFIPEGAFEPRGAVYLSAPATAGSGRFRLGLDQDGITGGQPPSSLTNDLAADTTYQALLRVDVGSDTSSLWVGTDINDFSEGAPTLTASGSLGTIPGLARIFLRQGNQIGVANSMTIDDVKVATAFSDLVVSAIPEASSFVFCAIVATAAVLLTHCRMKYASSRL